MMKYPNNEFSLEEASWAVNLSSGHTTLDADIGTRGRGELTREGRWESETVVREG